MQIDLPARFTTLQNFGRSHRAGCYQFEPASTEELREVFAVARASGLTIVARGAGRSYNDASLNAGRIVLDLGRMNRILAWDPAAGIMRCEPGVTLEQVWKTVVLDGWWPPVVSGTMRTTIGGCLAANIHGKNNFQQGPIGEHVLEFTALLPGGESVTCSRASDPELFYTMIGGFGMLGIFTAVTIKMKAIHSGLLKVHAWPVRSLKQHLAALLTEAPNFDYIVGWLDTTATGSQTGRGQIHAARYLTEGEDVREGETRRLENQVLPDRLLSVMPKSLLHVLMRPFVNDFGTRLVNTGKYLTALRKHRFLQSHAAFHFLLDYIPNWERAYGRGGLIQYQSFLPKEAAEDAWGELLRLSQRRGLPSYLGVTKRHRPDKFLLTHALDGFSLAMDFKVTDANRTALRKMLDEFDELVLQAGGRFYFAKNSETAAKTARRFLGDNAIQRFRQLKERCDPENLLESDLYRRVLQPLQ